MTAAANTGSTAWRPPTELDHLMEALTDALNGLVIAQTRTPAGPHRVIMDEYVARAKVALALAEGGRHANITLTSWSGHGP